MTTTKSFMEEKKVVV